jgi:hypothetical protein
MESKYQGKRTQFHEYPHQQISKQNLSTPQITTRLRIKHKYTTDLKQASHNLQLKIVAWL